MTILKQGAVVVAILALCACYGEQVGDSKSPLRVFTDSARGVACYAMVGANEISCVKVTK